MKNPEALIRVFTGSETSAILLRSRLEEAGISSIIKDDSSEAFLGIATQMRDLYIRNADLEKAKPLLAEIQ